MRTLVLLALLAVSIVSPRAGGLIIVHDFLPRPDRPGIPRPIPPPEVWPPRHQHYRHYPLAPLEISSESIDVTIKDQLAVTTIDQEFHNPNSQQLEGTFIFPIPKGAQLDKFEMEIGGKMMKPELLAADKARGIYEEIVRKAKDPALLEYADRDLLKVRIFPIEGNSKKKISLKYTQFLKADSGLLDYVLPLTPQKYSAKPIEKVLLKLALETTRPIKTVYSPTHTIELTRPDAKRASIKLETKDLPPDTDFQLLYSFEKSDVALSVLTHRPEGEDGYFLLLASPGIDAPDRAIVAKDVAFVLDTSGSMAGEKLEQAKKALQFCVRNLNESDRFEILRFASEIERLFKDLQPASKENVKKAESFIDGLKPIGGTAIDDALGAALKLKRDAERPFIVIFLTDGLPTVGVTQPEKIVQNVKDNATSARVFCFGIGFDVNTHLLDKIAAETRAFTTYVTPTEDIEVKVSTFFSKIREPLLADVKIEASGDVTLSKQYPSDLPDLFKGEQLIVAGRFKEKGKATVTLTGKVNGEKKTFSEKFEFPEKSSEHEFIPRLWATRRVGALLDQIRLNGESSELRDEVTELARKYGIVTPYTAYLIVEDEARRNVPQASLSMPAIRGREQRVELERLSRQLKEEKTGAGAVNIATANRSLQSADNYRFAADAQSLSLAAAAPAPAIAGRALSVATGEANATVALQQQASRFAAGRNFVLNNNQWVDSQAQALTNAKPVRVQFNSSEYFKLAADRELAPVLALGSNVQFVHKNRLYEIHD